MSCPAPNALYLFSMKIFDPKIANDNKVLVLYLDLYPTFSYILSSLAFMATITVLTLMRMAPAAGLSNIP